MEKNNNIDIINFANVQTPSFLKENLKNGKKYVNYGEDNFFPDQLLEYSDKSVTHSSCLKLIKLAIGGEGYEVQNEDTKLFLESLDFETDNTSLLENIADSLAIFDGFAFEIIWNKKGDKIVEIHLIPFQNLRAGHPDRYGNVLFYYYNSNWEMYPNSWEEISTFDPKLSRKNPKQILYCYRKSSKSLCYPIPNYNSSINYIVNEYELSKHYLSTSVNNFSPSSLISFIGNFSNEERQMIKNKFDNNFVGSEKSGKHILNFIESIENKTIIEPIQTNNVVDLYINSSQESKNQIITANGVTSPSLISIQDGNSIFGNGDEMLMAWNLFQKVTINSYQKMIEKYMNLILKYAGFNDVYSIIKFSPIDQNTNTNVEN